MNCSERERLVKLDVSRLMPAARLDANVYVHDVWKVAITKRADLRGGRFARVAEGIRQSEKEKHTFYSSGMSAGFLMSFVSL